MSNEILINSQKSDLVESSSSIQSQSLKEEKINLIEKTSKMEILGEWNPQEGYGNPQGENALNKDNRGVNEDNLTIEPTKEGLTKVPKEPKGEPNAESSKEKSNEIETSRESLAETLKGELKIESIRKSSRKGDEPNEDSPRKANSESPWKGESDRESTRKEPNRDSGNTIKIISIIVTGLVGVLGGILAFWYKKVEYDSKQPGTYLNPLIERIRKGIQPKKPAYGTIIPNKDLKEFLAPIKIQTSKNVDDENQCAMRIIVGQNYTGKTTAIMNELKSVENVLYLSFRKSNNKALTFEEILGEQLGVPTKITKQDGNLPMKILESAIEKVSGQGKQIILILEDLNNVIKYPQDYDQKLQTFKLPDYLVTFCGGLMQHVSFGECQVIITISDPSRSGYKIFN